MSHRKAVLVAALTLLALSGCATTAQINAGAGQFVGRPIYAAIINWGHPQRIMDVGPNKVYVWEGSNCGKYASR